MTDEQQQLSAPEPTDPHQSKIALDDPRLKIPRVRTRTLKRGPAILVVAGVASLVAIAVAVAAIPSGEPAAKEEKSIEAEASLAQTFPIPEAVQNAPDNSAPILTALAEPPPRDLTVPALGEPLPGQERLDQASPGGPPSQAEQRRLERAEALNKARAAGIFFSGDEQPMASDRPADTAPGGASPSDLQRIMASQPGAAPGGRGPGAGAAPGMGDQNMQDRKNAFVGGTGASDAAYLQQPLVRPRSPYEVKAGAIIPVVLLTGINSDLPGDIVGQVRENVYDTVSGNHLLIPQGSKCLAKYDSMVAFGQERILVCWNRIIRPDGTSMNLECMPGVDAAGNAGFADRVDHHWWRVISGVALGSLLSATAARSQGDVSGLQPSFPQMWAAGAAAQVNQAAQQITQKNIQIQPTITIRPGFSVNVLVTKDMILEPYSRVR